MFVCVLLLKRSRRKPTLVRVAYLGYAICALIVFLFQLHLYVDGPEIFIVFPLFLAPIVIFGSLALAMTVFVRSNMTLWMLGGSTLALGLFQFLTTYEFLAAFMNIIARSYVIFVVVASVYRRTEWWPVSHWEKGVGSG